MREVADSLPLSFIATIMRLFIFALAMAVLVLGWRTNVIGSVETWLRLRRAGALTTPDLEKNLSSRLVTVQQMLRVGELQIDDGLQKWLGQHVNMESPDMNLLIQHAQQAFPGYQQMAAMQKWGATEEELFTSLEAWSEIGGSDYTHLAVTVRPSWGNLGWHGCVIVGQRLPPFTPEALSNETERLYYSKCAICEMPQACKFSAQTRTVTLECARCGRIYAAVAPGTDGRFRYLNEFLEGYKPPTMLLDDRSRSAELLTIWQTVSTGCRYTGDIGAIQYTTAGSAREIWQTARETEMLRHGDCEDSSILLADWLLSRGFEARVALGHYTGPGAGGHAWVVVRLDGEEYLLEPTQGGAGARTLPKTSEFGSSYTPDVLFDRSALYVRQQPTARWNGGYWSEDTWMRLEPRTAQQ